MKTKILNFVSVIYNILKTEYWPYRYYILLYILFLTIFTMDLITYSRIIRFIVTLIIILIYKYLHLYINNYNIKNINVKFLTILMYYNIIINPVLYLVWNSYKYILIIKKFIKKTIKNKKLAIILISLIINITTPIRYLHMRYYKMLHNFQVYTIYEILFIRAYGLVISVLILSDIINYLLNKTGGIIYLIIYTLNVMYTCYIWLIQYIGIKFKHSEKLLNIKIIEYMKKLYIYKILLNYIKVVIDQNMTVQKVYYNRINNTITGSIIIKILNLNLEDLKKQSFFDVYIYKIPSIWRYYIYYVPINKLKSGNNYIDRKIYRIIHFNVNDICYELYNEIFLNISNIFVLIESVLYFKYFNSHKITDIKNYEYAYRLYILILKNILHFMWSVEYNIDKNKITRLYVDKEIGEYGYSIYFNESCNEYTELPLFTQKDFINNNFLNNVQNDFIYESIDLLINLNGKDWMYINYKENYGLKNLNNLHIKYSKLFDTSDYVNFFNVFTECEKEKEKNYILELNKIMQEIKHDWERLGPLDIFQNRTVFFELINHLQKDAKI